MRERKRWKEMRGVRMSIDVTIACDVCTKYFDDVCVNTLCKQCEDNYFVIPIKDVLQTLIAKKYIWENKEGYGGFDNEAEKELYMMGVKKGYFDALFWLSDYFDIVELFEKMSE